MTDVIVATRGETDAPHPELPPTRSETLTRLVALAAGTAAVTILILATGGWPWLVVVGSILVIIMLHEAGHFATAKWSGMKATEFFIGFGPKLWSIRRGETEYGIKAIPAGGYVKILGMTSLEELDPTDEPRSFVNQTTGKRVLVASAGSLVHLLLALILSFVALFWLGKGVALNQVEIIGITTSPGLVLPAQAAGMKAGDLLISINGVRTTSTNYTQQIRSSGGRALTILVRRGNHDLRFSVTPRVFPTLAKYPVLGVALAQPTVQSHPGFASSFAGAGTLVWQITDQTAHVFTSAFSPSGIASLATQVTNSKAGAAAKASGGGSVSMIGAAVLISDAAKAGAEPLLGILISLNISLGVLNMLPMLPLDGGHVAIALYERIRTRRGRARYRADVRKLMPVVYAFLGFLALFVVGKMYLDIAHGTANPFG